jgi:hypothetical protein
MVNTVAAYSAPHTAGNGLLTSSRLQEHVLRSFEQITIAQEWLQKQTSLFRWWLTGNIKFRQFHNLQERIGSCCLRFIKDRLQEQLVVGASIVSSVFTGTSSSVVFTTYRSA